jgi:hypothetical protein
LTFTHELIVDPSIARELHRLVNIQIIIAAALAIVSLAVVGAALANYLAVRKVIGLITPMAEKAQELTEAVEGRVSSVLETVDDVNARLRHGVQSVEQRVKQFGAVVDVVQAEAEDLLLDAASTAHGVHAASEALRSGKRAAIAKTSSVADEAEDEDVFTD